MILYLFFNVTSDLKLNSELSTARVHNVKSSDRTDKSLTHRFWAPDPLSIIRPRACCLCGSHSGLAAPLH